MFRQLRTIPKIGALDEGSLCLVSMSNVMYFPMSHVTSKTPLYRMSILRNVHVAVSNSGNEGHKVAQKQTKVCPSGP